MQKHSFKCFTLSVKHNILPFLFVLFTIFLVIFSKQNLTATHDGLLLCVNSVVPSLFPFFIATELLGYTNLISYLGKLFNKIMRPFFNVPGEGAFAFIMGIISGYPVGAKIVSKLYDDGLCTKVEAERLLAFTNNSGPLFIIGTVGISLFSNSTIGILLFITHLLASLTVAFLFRFWKASPKFNNEPEYRFSDNKNKNVEFKDLGEVLSKSISNAISSVVLIGGFVVFFSVVLSILNNCGFLSLLANILTPIFNFFHINTSFIKPILSGIIELTNGLKLTSNISIKEISINIIICSFLLGFGGFSVLLQVFSIIAKSGLSIKSYFIGKLLHGTIASIYTFLVIKYIPYFNFDITPVFSQANNSLVLSYINKYNLIILLVILALSSILIFKRKKAYKT